MKFSLFSATGFPDGDSGNAEFVTQSALTAEQSGFSAIAFSEHPAPSLKWLKHGGHESFDPFIALAYCAGVTEQLRLMPYLAVLPYRNPLLMAKTVASLDVLSGGRLTLVTGAGYLRSEFIALGVDFSIRNELLDESLQVLQSVWSGTEFSFTGRNFTALGQVSLPRPLQCPLPILVGGNSQVARQRAINLATGWAPVQMNPLAAQTTRTASLETMEEVTSAVNAARDLVSESGRDVAKFVIQLDAKATDFENNQQSMAERLEDLHTLSDIGVSQCVVHIPNVSLSATLDTIEEIGRDMVAHFA